MPKGHISIIPNEIYLAVACKIINEAKREILLSTYKLQFSGKPRARAFMALYTALISAMHRGVNIKILTHYSPSPKMTPHTNAACMKTLCDKGLDVRYLPAGRIAHAKILITDEKKLLTGSHNWSMSSLTRNFEMSVLITDSLSIIQAHVFFLHTWEAAADFD